MKTKKSAISVLAALIIMLILLYNIFLVSVFSREVVKKSCIAADSQIISEYDVKATYLNLQYDTFLEAYYRNLTHYFGHNLKGSCVYVAIGMLLSYYDTFLNDSIIPEFYDHSVMSSKINMNETNNSPGVAFDRVTDEELTEYNKDMISQLTANEYYEIIEKKASPDYSNASLHARLITIGKEMGYYNFKDNESPCGLAYNNITKVLKKYLTEVAGFNERTDFNIEVKSSTGKSVRSFIIENIKLGYPVMIGMSGNIKTGKDSAHELIAYDYDETNDVIYGHMGWDMYTTHENVENQYKTFDDAIVLKLNMQHTHTNNYKYGWDTYCYCDHRIITYKQTPHTYNNGYIDSGDGMHTAYCNCGTSEVMAHTYIQIEKYNSEYHKLKCVCGAFELQAHEWTQYVPLLSINGDKTVEVQSIEPNALGGGTGTYIQCKKCYFRKKLGDGEIIVLPGHGLSKYGEEEE